MRASLLHKWLTVTALGLGVCSGCSYDYFPTPPPPEVSEPTTTLEASYITGGAGSLSAAYWKTADYLPVEVTGISTGRLYPDGFLNMTGTYDGMASFNGGEDPALKLKAAYDDNNLYLLVEWNDSDVNASRATWFYDGPSDPLKTDSTERWTSQLNTDGLSLMFDIDGATGSSGTFASTGCNATCHDGAMYTESGNVDVWNWMTGLTEPLGYAMDYKISDTGLLQDDGVLSYVRNIIEGTGGRKGPSHQWNGVSQTLVKPDGSSAILDPGYFLYNTSPFEGDIGQGEAVYQSACASCHGEHGEGEDGPPFDNIGATNRLSNEAIMEFAPSFEHSGYTYFQNLNAQEKIDVIARIRGFSGVPGYLLQDPTGSCADIIVSSNISLVKVTHNSAQTTYSILMKRALETGNDDDVQFSPNTQMTYPFSIALMDNDGINHIGSVLETLTFLPKE